MVNNLKEEIMNTKLYQLTCDIDFTLTALRAKESLLNPYLQEQIDAVDHFYATYEALKKEIKSVTLERRTTDDRIELVAANAVKLLKEISFRVKADQPEDYKKYFPVNYSTVIKKEKSLLKAYKVVQSEIDLESIPSIFAFKEQVDNTYEALHIETNRITDAKTDHKHLQHDINKLYRDWNLEYRRLKLMIKAVLLGKETKYKIFFDTKSIKKVNKDKTESSLPILPTPITTPILDN